MTKNPQVQRKIRQQVGKILPFWGEALNQWFQLSPFFQRKTSVLSVEEALCEPLAQLELGVERFPEYDRVLQVYQWTKMVDLWRPEDNRP